MDSRYQIQKVHFFEMIAQEKFSKYLRSALLYIANVIFDRYPTLVALRYYKEHILSAFEVILQSIYLKKFGGTYSEFYYNIKRVLKNGEKEINGSKAHLLKTLIVGVIFPLVKQHIDSAFQELKDKVEEGEINQRNTSVARWRSIQVFLKTYPMLNMVYNIVNFAYNAKYLLDPNTKYFNILYHILGHSVTQIQEDEPTKGRFGFIVDFLKRYFVFALFLGTKFLEWYFDAGRRRSELLEKEMEHIDPPFVQESAETKNVCPLCQRTINIPCCLDTCGYVFCQVCVYDFVQKHGKCPMTQIECDVNNIHKIYES